MQKKQVEQITTEPLAHSIRPELVFGLIGPAGTDLKTTFKILKKALEDVSYKVPKKEIRLSDLIQEVLGKDFSDLTEECRIDTLMNAGTAIREKANYGGAVALLALLGIERVRREEFGDKDEGNAFILHSLKHPNEIEALRNIYGSGFYAISVYSPRESRVTSLATRITKSRHLNSKGSRAEAERLIEKDEIEEGKALGQNVKDVFPLADLFVDASDNLQLEKNINRFVELIFNHPYHTPSKDEYGMYHARSAALRSADLARQVGAAISTEEGDLVTVGCNDVPKFGGGLYWEGDPSDGRDFQKGVDTSNEQREHIIAEFLSRLRDSDLLKSDVKDIKKLVEALLVGDKKNVLKGSQILGLIEFGRSVHAEMSALMDAARRGVSVKDATLYTTTFPCHLCAKHIIAAGIKRVVYIEPYPKSKALELYSDSIAVDSTKHIAGRVSFEPFVGIAPRQYMKLFVMQHADSRKDKLGRVVEWPTKDGKPITRVQRLMNTYRLMERKLIAEYLPDLISKIETIELETATTGK